MILQLILEEIGLGLKGFHVEPASQYVPLDGDVKDVGFIVLDKIGRPPIYVIQQSTFSTPPDRTVTRNIDYSTKPEEALTKAYNFALKYARERVSSARPGFFKLQIRATKPQAASSSQR